MASPSRPAPAARPPKPASRISTRAAAVPHSRARASVPPNGRILGAPIAPLTSSTPSDVIPKAPALPTLSYGTKPLNKDPVAAKGTTGPKLAMPVPMLKAQAPVANAAAAPAAPTPAASPRGAAPQASPVEAVRQKAAPAPASPPASAKAENAPVSNDGLDPTVLLVGAGEKFTPAFQAALARHRVFVEIANPEAVLEAVVTTAPDLVLLMGDAARDCGNDLLTKLAALPRNFTVPVVILEDATELDSKLRAFRSGATAIIPRSASVDATAEQVARLARQIPEQGGEQVGTLGEATLEDFVSALSKQLRSELVSVVSPEGKEGDAVRLVLGKGRPLAEFMDLFVRRVRRHVLLAEPLRYELDEQLTHAAGETARPRSEPKSITNLRVILADDDTPRADSVAQELRNRGATVIVTDLDPTDTRFERLRQVDPTVLMIGESHVHGAGHSLLRRMRQDTRLRWASQLVVRWEEVWSDRTGELGIQRFESTLAGLAEPEAALTSRADVKAPFDTRLEMMGPARCLRALSACGHALRVTVQNPRAEVTVDLSDGLIVGVAGRALGDSPKTFEGANALSALLLLGSGRVHVEAVDQPATANVMAPVDVALNMADAEAPPIAPSIPAAGAVSIHPPFQGAPLPEPLRDFLPIPPAKTLAIQAPAGPAPRVALLPAPEATPPHAAPLPSLASPLPSHAPPPEVFHPEPTTGPGAQPNDVPTIPAPVEPFAPSAAFDPFTANAPTPMAAPVTAPQAAHAAAPGGELVERARRWYADQNEKFHAPRLSPSTAALLLGLAVLQGLLLVALYAGYRSFTRPAAPGESDAPAASAASPPRAAEAPKAPEPAPTPAATVAPTPREPDGSGRTVEDCKTLLAGNPPQNGYYPGAAQEQSRLGRAAIVHGNLVEARASYCRAVHWDPKNLEILLQLAQVLLLERDGPKALEYAERAAAIDATPTRVQEVLGDAYARVGAYEEARSAWFAASGLEATSAEAMRRLHSREFKQGDTALRRRNLVIAEKFFRRAAVLDPSSTHSMVGLSYVLTQLDDTGGAAFWARRAVKLAPRSPTAHLALGDALNAAKDTRAAIVEWREASLLDPNNNEALKRLRRAGVPPR